MMTRNARLFLKLTEGIAVALCVAIVGSGGVAVASTPADSPPPMEAAPLTTLASLGHSQKLSDREEIQSAVDDAFLGETASLDSLLKGPKVADVQAALAERLQERGDFRESDKLREQANAHSRELIEPRTGEYDKVCTGYDGKTYDWHSNEPLACHG